MPPPPVAGVAGRRGSAAGVVADCFSGSAAGDAVTVTVCSTVCSTVLVTVDGDAACSSLQATKEVIIRMIPAAAPAALIFMM
jgi:hypothetical protein